MLHLMDMAYSIDRQVDRAVLTNQRIKHHPAQGLGIKTQVLSVCDTIATIFFYIALG